MSGEADDIDPFLVKAFESACSAELRALKPGNVHDFAPGHRMVVADFEASAQAAAPAIARRGAGIGRRVFEGMDATFRRVGQNTNLGILLLAAPLAATWERMGECRESPEKFRRLLAVTLESTTRGDADLVYRAIRIANPGGLGSAAENDVSNPPEVNLLEAMSSASDRDRIARQYVTSYDDLFSIGLPAFHRATLTQGEGPWRTSEVFFAFAAGLPDTHVQRKHGAAIAEQVRLQFAERRGFLHHRSTAELLTFDSWLKSRSINPGTSADLTVATLLLAQLTKNK